MAVKCFIPLKSEDAYLKKVVQEDLKIDMLDKSLNEAVDSND